MSFAFDKESFSNLLRKAAREHLGLTDGKHWPSDLADAQADALVAEVTEMDLYKQGIVDFVSKMSADYRRHHALAVKEDVLMAVAYFDIDPSRFYSSPEQQEILKAEAELYRLTGKVPE